MTRPDIAYAVNMVSQFMHAPRTIHLHVAKRIFTYLQGTLDFGLFIYSRSTPTVVIAYSDADCAGCPKPTNFLN